MLKDMTQAARRARATELSFMITSCEKMIFLHVERYDARELLHTLIVPFILPTDRAEIACSELEVTFQK